MENIDLVFTRCKVDDGYECSGNGEALGSRDSSRELANEPIIISSTNLKSRKIKILNNIK